MEYDIESKIEKILKEDINTLLNIHNGFAILSGIEEEQDFLKIIMEFHGACSSCYLRFSSTINTIEQIFQSKLDNRKIKVINVETL